MSDQNVSFFGDFVPPTFTYTEDNSIMTGMQFKTEIRDSDAWVSVYNTEIEHTGYEVVNVYGMLIPNIDGKETYFSVSFKMVATK